MVVDFFKSRLKRKVAADDLYQVILVFQGEIIIVKLDDVGQLRSNTHGFEIDEDYSAPAV